MGKYIADMIVYLCIYLFILVVCGSTKLLACVCCCFWDCIYLFLFFI